MLPREDLPRRASRSSWLRLLPGKPREAWELLPGVCNREFSASSRVLVGRREMGSAPAEVECPATAGSLFTVTIVV